MYEYVFWTSVILPSKNVIATIFREIKSSHALFVARVIALLFVEVIISSDSSFIIKA